VNRSPTKHSDQSAQQNSSGRMDGNLPNQEELAQLQRNVTIGDLQKIVSAAVYEIKESLGGKIDNLVVKVQQLESRQDNLEQSVKELESNVHGELVAVREEIFEQKRRIMKMTNIVLMGVPESLEGMGMAQKVMKIIAPLFVMPLNENRVGDTTARKPRPLRLSFSSVKEKNEALKSCPKLKTHPELKHISVQRDLTKTEQNEWRSNATRRAKKRKNSGTDGGGGSFSPKTRMQKQMANSSSAGSSSVNGMDF
jgi:outer membrane murein-binding lipoprotein Lpp